MLIDKIPWCSHKGDPIFSLHTQSSGRRFATAGGDYSVKVWNLHAALDARQEENSSTHKLLATLNDHTGPVNVVRFSPSGQHLASGSDDTVACIFEYRPGSGGNVLGGEANIENWRTRFLLRGHSSHVVDLCWSPDGSLLATASLDSTVGIWDTSKGIRLHTITHHKSFVKGVAFDPVGTYLATYSEDKSICIWKTEDWSLVATIATPFKLMVSSTYACRMTWSPDGRFLLAGNSYQGATHAAVAIPREKWETSEEYMLISGHSGVVVTAAFNPHLFHVPSLASGEDTGRDENGKERDGESSSDELSALFCLGAQDKRITIWASSAQRPLFCGTKLFKSQVLDVAWTPDGTSLLASSTDGTIACLQFDTKELGTPATREEMDEIMKSLYGSTSGRHAKRAFAESAEQLDMEQQGGGGAGARRDALAMLAGGVPSRPPPAAPAIAAPAVVAAAAGKKSIAALDARLGASGLGVSTQTGFAAAPTPIASTSALTTTAATTITAIAKTKDAHLMPPPPHPQGRSRPTSPDGKQSKRARLDAARNGGMHAFAPIKLLDAPTIRPALRISIEADPPLIVSTSNTANTNTNTRSGRASLPQTMLALASPPSMLELHATNTANHDIIGSLSRSEIALVKDGTALWTDVVCGQAIALAGTSAFSAVATSDGHVIIYTPAGRRILAPIKIGPGVAILQAKKTKRSAGRLLTVSTTGALKVIEVVDANSSNTMQSIKIVAESKLASLLEGGGQSVKVIDVALSQEGTPMVSLSDASSYIWHEGIREWMKIADDTIALSRFGPVLHVPGQGELGIAQAVAYSRGTMPTILGKSSTASIVQYNISRGHAEASLAAAQTLHSIDEYKKWLVSYAAVLTESHDEGRLKELCDSLLGGAASNIFDGVTGKELLDGCVLPEIAKNRGLGALLQRCRQASIDLMT